MKNIKLLNELNGRTDGKYSFLRLAGIDLVIGRGGAESVCRVAYFYPEKLGASFADEYADEVTRLTREILSLPLKIDVEFKKSCLDVDLLKAEAVKFLAGNPSLASAADDGQTSVTAADGSAVVSLTFPEPALTYARAVNFGDRLAEHLDSSFCAEFTVKILKRDEDVSVLPSDADERASVKIDPGDESVPYRAAEIKYTAVADVAPFIGGIIEEKPRRLCDLKSPLPAVTVAGKIVSLRVFDIKKGRAEGCHAISMNIDDGTGTARVSYFSRPDTDRKALTLKTGDTVIVSGRAAPDDFAGGALSVTARSVNFCALLRPGKDETPKTVKNPPPAAYKTVFPKKRADFIQTNLLGARPAVCEYLRGRDFVVLDLETTGLNPRSDKITEISAVKISDGVISEEFASLIDPGVHIPDDVTALTGLSDADVRGAPKIEDVIGDFYRFTDGCALVAHHMAFDHGFISREGAGFGYVFDNELIDTLTLARKYVRGLPHYNLKTVCKALGVENKSAHRALSDAVAAAEVLLKIAPKIA